MYNWARRMIFKLFVAMGILALLLPAGTPLVAVQSVSAATPLIVHPYTHFKTVCPTLIQLGSARCYSQVVTNDSGQQLASASLLTGSYGPSAFLGAYGVGGTSATTRTVAIVDAYDNPTILNDLDTYSNNFGIPKLNRCAVSTGTTANPCIQKVDQNGGTSYPTYDSGWALEIALDVEAVHAMCQNCNILLVEAASSYTSDLISAADQRAYTMGANVVSNSWGGSEYSGETTLDSSFNHPGVAYVFSTGDSGYGAQSPASSPNVVAVGGTTLLVNSDYTYNSETAWSGGGSGCSAYEPKPSFQHDTGCSKRTLADVSADANPNTGAAVYTNGSWYQVGGTSLSAPLVAAVIALAGGVGNTLGNSLPYANLNYGVNLRDVTSGNNGSCSGSYLCTAMAGYDGPTGLGSLLGTTAFIPTSTQTLTVNKSGTGVGTVTSNPTGINCGSTCSYGFAPNTIVTLSASATSPSTFSGWSGAGCSGTGTCQVTMSAAQSVTATFNAPNQTLTVSKAGTGAGTVTSNPTGINCGSICSYSFTYNTVVTLTAAATSPSVFGGWSGAGCSGTGTCKVTMSAAQSVTATFNPPSNQTLTVTKTGNGSGTVTSNPTGINCGTTCSGSFTYNTSVVLTAVANTGSTFTGWSGANCSGTGTCTISMTSAKSVTANFSTATCYSLTTAVSPAGRGTIQVNIAPNCGSNKYLSGTVIKLTAVPSAGHRFTRWSGSSTSTNNPLTLTMNANKSLTANFR